MKLKKATPKVQRTLMDAVLQLDGNELKTYIYAKDLSAGKDKVEFKHRTAGKILGLSSPTIKRCIKSLAEKGWVEILKMSAVTNNFEDRFMWISVN